MAITITNVTEKIAVNGETPIMFGDSGLIQEVFEAVDSGGTAAGASLAPVPRFIQDIRSLNSTVPVADNLNLATVNATVTLTTKTATGNGEKYRITLIGRR